LPRCGGATVSPGARLRSVRGLRSGAMEHGRERAPGDDDLASGLPPRLGSRRRLPDAERPDAARQEVLRRVRLQARRCHADRSAAAAAAAPLAQLERLERSVHPQIVPCNRGETAWVSKSVHEMTPLPSARGTGRRVSGESCEPWRFTLGGVLHRRGRAASGVEREEIVGRLLPCELRAHTAQPSASSEETEVGERREVAGPSGDGKSNEANELGRRGLSAAWLGTLEELHWHGTREISGAWRCSRKTVPGSCCLLATPVPTECGEFGCRLR
jgi:hypothetical protein